MHRDWGRLGQIVYVTFTSYLKVTTFHGFERGKKIHEMAYNLYIYHEHISRTASTWHVFPLTPWCPLGYSTCGDDHVDGNAFKVKGSEEFLCKVSYMLMFERGLGSAYLGVRIDVKAGG